MKTFYLFINNQDIESNKFDFSPMAKNLILHPRETLKLLSNLKKGEIITPEDENKILGKYYLAEEKHIDDAINSSFSAFQTFRKFSLAKKAQILVYFNSLLIQKKDEFVNLLIAEGHPKKLAIWQYENMVNGTSKDNVKFYLSMIEKRIKLKKEEIIITKKPDGVMLLIPPRNAPASNSLVAISALMNGNTIIVKPPQKLPASTIFLWRNIVQKALDKIQAPRGVINIIQGNSVQILDRCLSSEKVKTFFIFGESGQGMKISNSVFANFKKPISELSGNDMMIIWKDAKFNEKLLESILESFLGSTQVCMVPKIILIHYLIYEKLLEFVIKNIRRVKAGLPEDDDTWLSPVGKKKEFFEFLKDAQEKGAEVICGGKTINKDGREDNNGIFIEPTILKIENIPNFQKMLCYQNEIFFPLIPFVKMGLNNESDESIADKMIDLIEKNRYGLRVSIWIKNNYFKNKFINEINNCGSIRINSRHIGFSKFLSTHGGVSLSGGPLGELNYMCLRAGHFQGISIKDAS
jgi:acyl-CoA reductase-like NAD-dependent aldehyde dehydrogenase